MSHARLNAVLQRRDIWRGQAIAGGARLGTGFAELDRAYGGWPLQALTEILCAHQGIGELRVLMPALAALSRRRRWIAWIAPPHLPYAPALAAQGVRLERVLLVHPKSEQEALWATETALRAGSCAAVLSWVGAASPRELRRLQLAAEEGKAWGVLFRPPAHAREFSPAALRLRLTPAGAGHVQVDVLKSRGVHPPGPLLMSLAH